MYDKVAYGILSSYLEHQIGHKIIANKLQLVFTILKKQLGILF